MSILQLKKEIEEEKRKLKKRKRSDSKVKRELSLKKELNRLKNQNRFYNTSKIIRTIQTEGKSIGQRLGAEFNKAKQIQDEKEKRGFIFR